MWVQEMGLDIRHHVYNYTKKFKIVMIFTSLVISVCVVIPFQVACLSMFLVPTTLVSVWSGLAMVWLAGRGLG